MSDSSMTGEDHYTSIRITKEVRSLLVARGRKGQTYSEIVFDAIDEANHYRVMRDMTIEVMKPKPTGPNGKV